LGSKLSQRLRFCAAGSVPGEKKGNLTDSTLITGCALSRLHSQPLINYWLRAVALAFAAAHQLLVRAVALAFAAAHQLTGCALSRLHSQPLINYWLRAVALAFAAAHQLLAARCRACIRSRSSVRFP